jgi:integrase
MRGDGTVYLRRWRRGDGVAMVRPWLSYWLRNRNFREPAAWIVADGDARQLKAAMSEAQKQLRRRLAEIQTGTFVTPGQDRVTVAQALEGYLENRRLAGKPGLENIEQRCAKLKSRIGFLRLVDITLPRLEALANELLTEGFARGTVKVDLAYLRAALNVARKRGVVVNRKTVMIAHRSDFPTIRVDNARQGFFERSEFEAVREALRTRGPHGPILADVAAFGYLSGWRISEILELPWAYVDRRERLITLPSTGSSKRKKDRTLPLDYRLPNGEWANGELWQLIERRWQARVVGTFLVPWVFHRRGKPIRDVLYSWRKACAAARVVGRIPHDFRRTRVRDLLNAGVPEKVAMEWTGHQTREVFDRYHIVTAEDQRRALARVEAKAAAADNVVSITQPVQGTRRRSRSGR